LCPDDICKSFQVPKIKPDHIAEYWAAVAKFVRFGVAEAVDSSDYDSDDEVDLNFLDFCHRVDAAAVVRPE
jgi:hypothetical protein